jgi:NAD+ diphosphatase
VTTPAAADRTLLTNLTLSRAVHDRAEHLRFDQQAWQAIASDPATPTIVVHGSRVAVGADPVALLRVPLGEVLWPHTLVLLAVEGDTPIVAALVAREVEVELPGSERWGDLRELGAVVSDADAGLLVTAIALAHWHASHHHCPTCGHAVTVANAGWAGVCPEHGEQHPRTDPAVIVLVRDADDRALLGRRGEWTQGWYSTLAGFVEAGESAEQAVVREVAEESNIAIDPTSLVYLGSQPWPFPRSLMLGYHAFTADASTAKPDGDEITEVRWFTRDELAAGCATGEVRIPPRVSVARRLIERWYGAELPGAWSRP